GTPLQTRGATGRAESWGHHFSRCEQFLRGCSKASRFGLVCACSFQVVLRPVLLDLEPTIDNCAERRIFPRQLHALRQVPLAPALRVPDRNDLGVGFGLNTSVMARGFWRAKSLISVNVPLRKTFLRCVCSSYSSLRRTSRSSRSCRCFARNE